MDYWPTLPPVKQLPFAYRAWAWWLRNGPKRREGTLGGNRLFALLKRRRYWTLTAPSHPSLTIDLGDFDCFHHAMAVWYRGDPGLAMLRRLTKGPGTFIDIGANYGAYALTIAMENRVPVIAVEPQKTVAEALRRSAAINGFSALTVVECALGETRGTSMLRVQSGGSGTASLVRHAGAVEVPVQTSTLDTLCDELRVPSVWCLKIDVEGAEASVLRGAASTIARHRPFIMFEAAGAADSAPAFAVLREFGYTEFFDQASATAGEPVEPRVDLPLTNVVAVPREKRDRLVELIRPL